MSDATVLATVRVSLPFTLEVGGCRVRVLEVKRYEVAGRRGYLVSCQAECGSSRTPVFFLDVASNTELLWKLKVELAKFKLVQLG